MLPALGALALVAVACAPAPDGATPAASGSGTASATPAASASCTKEQLKLVKPGTLTIGTDKPAYEPWFKDDKPASGEGFESAVAYAVAGKLGFANGEVSWATVPFGSAFTPGDKQFDFDINQVSITPARAKAVDFSTGYYTVKQAVVALEGSKAAAATSLAALKDVKIGVQVGTTALRAVKEVIQPGEQPNVYNEQIDAVSALKNKQVDALVVDLPTAFYVTAAQVPGSKIVGQFGGGLGTPEEFGLVLQKGNPLVTCLDQAIGDLKASGELAAIETKWLGSAAGAPELK
ncbi:ABC transporter substrate-binding protein [Sphaerisporangium melleum]|nr:ABC transporter substrate-binding protein [Sphaerisporangium melleum]